MHGAVVADHGPTLTDMASAGVGTTQLFDDMADAPVRRGELSLLFEREIAGGADVYAVCAPGRKAVARVRAAFEAFADAFS